MRAKFLAGLFALTASAPIFSQDVNSFSANGDVIVPNVSSTSDVSDKRTGMIIFDVTAGQFKGYNKSGSWDAMTVPNGNPLTSGGNNYRIESVIIAGASETTGCTGTCTAYRNSGS